MCKSLWLLERVKGIEPSSQAWEARILPLNHTRFSASILAAPAALTSLNWPCPICVASISWFHRRRRPARQLLQFPHAPH
jgi:hypothetical protein